MVFKLIKIILTNFMMYGEKEVDFSERTSISGKNGKGKSSIYNAYTWLMFNCDSDMNDNPSVRRTIDGKPVNDMDVSVEAVFDMDGKEIKVKKVQRRKFSKDGSSYADDNSYFVNDVPKTLRDYNDYFGVDMNHFKMCSIDSALVGNNAKDMRKFLFGTVDEISDMDVALKFDDMKEISALLEKYSLDEIEAMNKASKAKYAKELALLEGQIKEKERDCTPDIDFAELELQKKALVETVASIETKINDSSKACEEFDKKTNGILKLKFDINAFKSNMNKALREDRASINEKIVELSVSFNSNRRECKQIADRVGDLKAIVAKKEVERKSIQKQWLDKKKEVFREYEELPAIDADSLICPTCGQPLTEEQKSDKIADYEQRKADHKASYDRDKASFERGKKLEMADIEKAGNKIAALIKKAKEDIPILEAELKEKKESVVALNAEETKLREQLEELPTSIDLSENEEYQKMISQLEQMEKALAESNKSADYRSQLNMELSEARNNLVAVETKIAKADTTEAEKRLADLKQIRLDLEQSKANCEKILNLLAEFNKHKNGLLESVINEKFQFVQWKLFEEKKNGGYKDACIPVIDGKSILSIASNKGNRILGKLDICNSIQKICNINCPVFLDDGESLDTDNTQKSLEMMDCQMILMKVTDDDFKVEV